MTHRKNISRCSCNAREGVQPKQWLLPSYNHVGFVHWKFTILCNDIPIESTLEDWYSWLENLARSSSSGHSKCGTLCICCWLPNNVNCTFPHFYGIPCIGSKWNLCLIHVQNDIIMSATLLWHLWTCNILNQIQGIGDNLCRQTLWFICPETKARRYLKAQWYWTSLDFTCNAS